MTLDNFITLIPAVVGVLYGAVAVAYVIKGDLAWALVWASYGLANVGLILVGMNK
jgi:hypothetical protein